MIRCLNSLWRNKNFSKENNKLLDGAMVESAPCYDSKIWVMSADTSQKVSAIKMDSLRRSVGVSRLQHLPKEKIRKRLNGKEALFDMKELGNLRYFGHLLRMPQNRWRKHIFASVLPDRGKKGRP